MEILQTHDYFIYLFAQRKRPSPLLLGPPQSHNGKRFSVMCLDVLMTTMFVLREQP